MPLLSRSPQTCQACGFRGRCWMAIVTGYHIYCRACWPEYLLGPLPETT